MLYDNEWEYSERHRELEFDWYNGDGQLLQPTVQSWAIVDKEAPWAAEGWELLTIIPLMYDKYDGKRWLKQYTLLLRRRRGTR